MATKEALHGASSKKPIPDAGNDGKPVPKGKQSARTLPQTGNPENTITLGDILIEIKPTKLLYQRNRTAAFYKLLDIYPLADILAMETGTFGDDRDGDKGLFDWLVAVTDNEELIRAYYDEMDTELIERILAIFKRVNRIDEKEAHQKKLIAAKG